MKVLVTGGAGFIGAHLVAALVSEGAETIVLDNLRRGQRTKLAGYEASGMVKFIEGDVRDSHTLTTAANGASRIYHLAAQSNVLGAVSDMDYSFTTNVVGTYNVLRAAAETGVERVIFTSSREVYGEVDTIPVAEDRMMNPKNAYGASKVAGEVYCRAMLNTNGLDVSVLRLANVYGPGDSDRVIPIWLERARHGQDLELFGGEQVLDLVPVRVVVAALLRAGALTLAGQPVNIGSGQPTTLRTLAERVQTLPGVHIGQHIRPGRSIEVTRFVADVGRMRSLLGVEPPNESLEDLPGLWDAMAR
jgi:UDP-glucose 4-epimerase